MYLEYALSDVMLPHSNTKPRANFIEYCDDLKNTIGGCLVPRSLKQDFGFSFSTLMDQFISHHENVLLDLRRAHFCVMISVGCEYDPVYSHLGVYLAEKYGIACDVIDVMEQGVLSVVTALHLLHALFSEKEISRAVILGLDQRVMPVIKNHTVPLPAVNAVSMLSLVRECRAVGLQCIYVDKLPLAFPFLSHRENGVFFYAVSTDLLPIFTALRNLLHTARQQAENTLYVLLIKDSVSQERGVVVLKK